jgi:hypothetical protein
LKERNASSVKGAGERSSQAQRAVNGRPSAVKWPSMARKPSASGTSRTKRARSISKPGSAATPAEYWKTPFR